MRIINKDQLAQFSSSRSSRIRTDAQNRICHFISELQPTTLSVTRTAKKHLLLECSQTFSMYFPNVRACDRDINRNAARIMATQNCGDIMCGWNVQGSGSLWSDFSFISESWVSRIIFPVHIPIPQCMNTRRHDDEHNDTTWSNGINTLTLAATLTCNLIIIIIINTFSSIKPIDLLSVSVFVCVCIYFNNKHRTHASQNAAKVYCIHMNIVYVFMPSHPRIYIHPHAGTAEPACT